MASSRASSDSNIGYRACKCVSIDFLSYVGLDRPLILLIQSGLEILHEPANQVQNRQGGIQMLGNRQGGHPKYFLKKIKTGEMWGIQAIQSKWTFKFRGHLARGI